MAAVPNANYLIYAIRYRPKELMCMSHIIWTSQD